ncbi:MAG: peptide ABC transporter substrate-binding protein [Minisyncoccia bacterium]
MSSFKLPTKDQLNSVLNIFSKKERVFFFALVIIFFLSTIAILESINKSLMVSIPARGGSISEGIIGTPRFINPILANSPADLDMVSLIYSGLMRKNSDGTLTPDLAKSYIMSQDGLSYIFTLKDKIYFQDGHPVTADDVVWTINEAKDMTIQSPRAVDWNGVSVAKIDDKTVKFSLKQPYPSFLENATLGIMPRYLWNNSPIELNSANTNPIGSGPYMVKSSVKESSGMIDSFTLAPFKKFALGEPYVGKLNLYFYSNENDLINALENGTVDQISSIAPLNAEILKERNYQIKSSVLPRIFGLFFNQNVNNLFTDKIITNAIDQTIDKDKIVREVLFGYGIAIDGPIPPDMLTDQNSENNDIGISADQILQKTESSLTKDGWVKGTDGFLQKTIADKNKKKTVTTLEFSISTGDAPELVKTAELIKQDLAQIGMKVDIKTFEVGNLNQEVIRPRNYDALLFGEIINQESDLYAFWHSSQRKDPGLNVASYTNAKVDKLLENAATTIDATQRAAKYAQIENMIKEDMPAVFLYSPNFIYVVSPNVKGLSIDHITTPSDRFADVYQWYTKTEDVWKMFAPTH